MPPEVKAGETITNPLEDLSTRARKALKRITRPFSSQIANPDWPASKATRLRSRSAGKFREGTGKSIKEHLFPPDDHS